MSDFKRLEEQHAGSLEATLIRAVREERPSSNARAKTLAALAVGGAALAAEASSTAAAASQVGLGGAGSAVTTAAGESLPAAGYAASGAGAAPLGAASSPLAAASKASLFAKVLGGSGLVKLGAAGIASGAIIAANVQLSSTDPVPEVKERAALETQPEATGFAGQRPTGKAVPVTQGLSPDPAAEAQTQDEAQHKPPAQVPKVTVVRNKVQALPQQAAANHVPRALESEARTTVAAPAAAEPASSAEPSVLVKELASVDRARAALHSGGYASVIRELGGYESEFKGGRLEPEVLYLRMQAYAGLGQVSSAERVARSILKYYPNGPHAARARKLLEN